jgi:hypothetical protein
MRATIVRLFVLNISFMLLFISTSRAYAIPCYGPSSPDCIADQKYQKRLEELAPMRNLVLWLDTGYDISLRVFLIFIAVGACGMLLDFIRGSLDKRSRPWWVWRRILFWSLLGLSAVAILIIGTTAISYYFFPDLFGRY